MEEKRKNVRAAADWSVSFKVYKSFDYVVDEFKGRFTVPGLMHALRNRGINFPIGVGIRFVNENVLTDKRLYKKYPELTSGNVEKDIIDRMANINEYELKRLNRSLIDRGDAERSPTSQAQSVLHTGSRIKDISESGICVLTKICLPVDTILELEVRKEDTEGAMRLWARIVRTRDLPDDRLKFEMGLVFIGMDYVRWKKIHDYIVGAKTQQLPPSITTIE